MKRQYASSEAKLLREKQRYAANREVVKARMKAYRDANPEKVLASQMKYALLNRDLINERASVIRERNREKNRLYAVEYRRKNKEKAKRCVDAWHQKNPDAMRIKKSNRRARQKASGGTVSRDLVRRLLELQKFRCVNCKVDLREAGSHLDHIVPLAKGGAHTDGNMQLLCPTCNMRKSDKDPIEWAQQQGRLL